MPQADIVLTVPLDQAPMGFFADIAPIQTELVDNVRIRLEHIAGMLFLMKHSETLDRPTAAALAGIETAIVDCGDLLSVCAGAGA